jgi:hypothetical protein
MLLEQMLESEGQPGATRRAQASASRKVLKIHAFFLMG